MLVVAMVTACNRNGDDNGGADEPDPVVDPVEPDPAPPVDDPEDDPDDWGDFDLELPPEEEIPLPGQEGDVPPTVQVPTAGRLLGDANGVPLNRAQIMDVIAQAPAPSGQIVVGDGTVIQGNFVGGFSSEATGTWVNDLLHGGRGTTVAGFNGATYLNPLVTRSLEAVDNPDGTRTFTFHIYTDNVWSDGTPITAIDYVFGILAYSSPAMASVGATVNTGLWIDGFFEYRWGRSYEDGPTDAQGNLIPGLSHVENEEGNMVWVDADGEVVTGEHTNYFRGLRLHGDDSFSVTIRSQGIPFVWEHLYQGWGVTPFHYWNYGGDMVITDTPNGVRIDNLTDEWISSRVNAPDGIRFNPTVVAGPYRIQNWDAGSNNIVLERNPYFQGTWDGFMPQIQTIAIVNSPADIVMDSLRIGHIDMVHAMRAGVNIAAGWQIVEDLGTHRGADFPRHGYGYLAWHADHGPGQFPEVRRAIAWLIDRYDFARTFTGGWGTVQHGPYALTGLEFSMVGHDLYNHPDFTHYGFNPANALQELINGGWVYNSAGEPFEPGVDQWRYRDVTGEYTWQGESRQDDAMTFYVDGRYLMRLEMIWAANDNEVSNIMRVVLPPEAEAVGMHIIEELYPAGTNNIPAWQRAPASAYVRGAERFRAHHIYTLAVGLAHPSQVWNQWSLYPEQEAPGFNTTWHGDWELHRLAWAMRPIDPQEDGWLDRYLEYWLQFQLRYNYWMPLLPLYADDDHDFVPLWLNNWESHGLWGFAAAVQRAYDGR